MTKPATLLRDDAGCLDNQKWVWNGAIILCPFSFMVYIPFWKSLSLEDLSAEIDGFLYKEEWRKCDGIDYYEISSFGRIKSLPKIGNKNKTSILTSRIRKDGYLQVSLYVDGKVRTVKNHRLVALCFIENPNNYPEVNHIDGIKQNPFYRNLEWTDKSGNQKHARRTGLCSSIGETHKWAKLNNEQVIELFNSKLGHKELSEKYNIAPNTVRQIKRGCKWSHLTGKVFKEKHLSEKTVLDIYNSSLSLMEICSTFGVKRGVVGNIKNGVRWGYLTGKKYIRQRNTKSKEKDASKSTSIRQGAKERKCPA